MDRYIKIFKNWKTEKANFKIQKKYFLCPKISAVFSLRR